MDVRSVVATVLVLVDLSFIASSVLGADPRSATGLFSTERYIAYVHFVCLGLIFTWFGFNRFLQKECPQAVRKRMPFEETSPRTGWLGCD